MTQMELSIERIMAAPVAGLVRLPKRDFDLVMALLVAARLEAMPVEIKPEVKHGKKSR